VELLARFIFKFMVGLMKFTVHRFKHLLLLNILQKALPLSHSTSLEPKFILLFLQDTQNDLTFSFFDLKSFRHILLDY